MICYLRYYNCYFILFFKKLIIFGQKGKLIDGAPQKFELQSMRIFHFWAFWFHFLSLPLVPLQHWKFHCKCDLIERGRAREKCVDVKGTKPDTFGNTDAAVASSSTKKEPDTQEIDIQTACPWLPLCKCVLRLKPHPHKPKTITFWDKLAHFSGKISPEKLAG